MKKVISILVIVVLLIMSGFAVNQFLKSSQDDSNGASQIEKDRNDNQEQRPSEEIDQNTSNEENFDENSTDVNENGFDGDNVEVDEPSKERDWESGKGVDTESNTSTVPENNGEHVDMSEKRKELWGKSSETGETRNSNAKDTINQETGEKD